MSPQTLAPYVLCCLAAYHAKGRMASLQTLVDDLHVRRADVRATMTALHREGLVDAINTVLKLQGFALAMRFKQARLPPLRGHQSHSVAAA